MFLTSIRIAWSLLAMVWLIAAMSAKRTVRAESMVSKYTHRLLLALVIALLFWPRTRIGFLHRDVLPHSNLVELIGATLTWIGIAFAIWARSYLGRNWSATVTIKDDHQLIRCGPYAWVRHPIYSGLLLALLGTAMESGQLGCFLAVAIAFFSWLAKCGTEEAFLLDRFHGAYERYREEVSALIPFVL